MLELDFGAPLARLPLLREEALRFQAQDREKLR